MRKYFTKDIHEPYRGLYVRQPLTELILRLLCFVLIYAAQQTCPRLQLFLKIGRTNKIKYSRTSVARTLMTRLPRLFRTRS